VCLPGLHASVASWLWPHVLAAVQESARRRDRHRCLQHDDRVLAAHRAAVHEPAVIGLVLGYG